MSIKQAHKKLYRIIDRQELGQGRKESTSLKEASASITSFVNVFPIPDVPIRTVGLIA